jgi:FAD:protein FMN transferase
MSSNLLAAAIALSTVAASLQPYEAVEPHMGTLFRIKLYAANQEQAERAFRGAFDRIAELDGILSDYKPDSELNRLCRNGVHRPVAVSSDLFRVISASEKLSEESGGAFDITLGPLTHLWRAARNQNRLSDSKAIQEAQARCGFRKLHIDAAQHTVELDQENMQLDVGGIAKGYAADEALVVLSKVGVRSALVAASGDLAFSDGPPGERGWKVGIDSFDTSETPFTRILRLANAAVSTSGASDQHLDANGTRYSHIIDPKTAKGLTRPITVTIVAGHGIDSDGMSTAVSVLGAEEGLAFVERQPGVAALIVTGERHALRVLESPRFRLLAKAEAQ